MNRALLAAGLGGLLAIGAIAATLAGGGDEAAGLRDQRIGLMTSLPIYRAPQASVADALAAGDAEEHWLRAELEEGNTLDPVDLLDPATLSHTDILLLIQPRALTPEEYVALDDWVRAGGQVLLVADPMLTSEPSFALGDPRNPQAIALTGPIHARWGLSLEPGTDGDEAERMVEIGGHAIPVAHGGRFEKRPPAGGDPADCALQSGGLVAVCAIGQGRAVLVADATFVERDPAPADAIAVLGVLLGMTRDASAR